MENIKLFELIKLAPNMIVDLERPRNSIIYISMGSVNTNRYSKERTELDKGFQLLLPQGMTIQLRAKDETTLLVCQFNIAQHFTQNEIKQLIENSEHLNRNILDAPKHLQTFWSLIHLYIDEGIDMSDIAQLLENQLFILLKKSYSSNLLGTFFAPILGQDLQFTQFVIENCLKVKSVEDFAKQANYSTSGFIKKFQRCFNCAPHTWIINYKARKIIQDIHYTQMSFSEIADKYEFGSYSYFYVFCKKQYHSSPLKLRRKEKSYQKEEKQVKKGNIFNKKGNI